MSQKILKNSPKTLRALMHACVGLSLIVGLFLMFGSLPLWGTEKVPCYAGGVWSSGSEAQKKMKLSASASASGSALVSLPIQYLRFKGSSFPITELKALPMKRCFLPMGQEAWERGVYVQDGNIFWPFVLRAMGTQTHQEASLLPLFFNSSVGDEIAVGYAYERGPTTSSVVVVEFPVDGSGYLRNAHLQVFSNSKSASSSQSTQTHAFSSEGEFLYEEESFAFAETAAFIYVNRMRQWLLDLLPAEHPLHKSLDEPVQVKIFSSHFGDVNQAAYIPAAYSFSGQHEIVVGKGDGVIFKDPHFHQDIFSHEFSHQVIFQYLKGVQYESKLVHEGVADFLTMAMVGSNCMAPGLCRVEGSSQSGSKSKCWDAYVGQLGEDMCLRKADGHIRFDTPILKDLSESEFHFRSQVVSGFLWQIHETIQDVGLGLGPDDSARLTLEALTYLKPNSGLRDFLVSYMKAAQTFENEIPSPAMTPRELSSSSERTVLSCFVYEKALQNGFEGLLKDVDCKSPLPASDERSAELEIYGKEKEKKVPREKGRYFYCGMGGLDGKLDGTSAFPYAALFVFAGLMAPLMIGRRKGE